MRHAEAGLVEALEACGWEARLTVYPGAGHNVCERAYNEPELYDWLLSQSLE